MSSLENVTAGRVAAVAAAAAVSAAVGVAVARKLTEPKVPTGSEWRRVGTLKELYLFPLKSGKPVKTTHLMAEDDAAALGPLRDRSFVAVDRTGRFVSGRTHPGLLGVTIKPVADKEGKKTGLLELSSPRVDKPVVLDTDELKSHTVRKITVWGCSVSAVDCGDEAAAFIRRAAVDAEKHAEASTSADLRLGFFPLERTDRRQENGGGIYSDQTSYHALISSSIDALNAKLEVPVTTLHFRPNFVVDGPAAFADDAWQWMRIGRDAIFKTVMPCGRCVLTTVDPETGVKSETSEPLATLRKFRSPTPEQKKAMKGSDAPVMGNRLSLVKPGEICLNDEVYVYP